ncbi:MAG: DUF3160 domain-containing protein [Ardenticatenales bacterium]|nr:DUF3160 domain-containing protein [Ardenticatenales bacterium]
MTFRLQGDDETRSALLLKHRARQLVRAEARHDPLRQAGHGRDGRRAARVAQRLCRARARVVLARGGIYSQYAFVQPSGDRLTNEQWRARLGCGGCAGDRCVEDVRRAVSRAVSGGRATTDRPPQPHRRTRAPDLNRAPDPATQDGCHGRNRPGTPTTRWQSGIPRDRSRDSHPRNLRGAA